MLKYHRNANENKNGNQIDYETEMKLCYNERGKKTLKMENGNEKERRVSLDQSKRNTEC